MKGKTIARPTNNGSAAGSDQGIAEFIDDLVNLSELQVRLAVVDFKETARQAAIPFGLSCLSLTVMAASVPVILLGLARLLATRLNIDQGWAMIVVAGAAAALASPVAAFGLVRLSRGFNSFRASRAELRRNLGWLRSVLVARGHSHVRKGA